MVKLANRSKKYRVAAALVEQASYTPADGVGLVKRTSVAGFDETVELHLRTSADPRHADQQIRGVAVLPHGLGKPIRVLAFLQGEAARAATAAGAEYVGSDDLVARIEGGWTDFDVALATPDMMGKIGRLGRFLGRRGLMPNPRTGTVVPPERVAEAVSEAKRGRVEFRLDRTAIIHVPIGKVSFDEQRLEENLIAVVDAVNQHRPAAIKGRFVRSAYLTTTMGPGVPLDVAATMALKVD